MCKVSTKATQLLVSVIHLFCFFHQNNSQGLTAGRNIALEKPAWQFPGTESIGLAGKAVDGNTNPSFDRGSCSHTLTQSKEPALWTVDLGDLYYVTGVIIYNRDSFQERLRKFRLYGYPGNVTLYDDANQIVPQYRNAIIYVKLDSRHMYRNITVYLPTVEGEATTLTLCEVEIFGGCYVPHISNGSFSSDVTDTSVVTYRTKIQASCSTGYKLGSGESTLTCGYNYTWDNPVPECTVITCRPLTLCNGLYTYRKGDIAEPFAFGSIATAKCDKGFEFQGSREKTCSEHGYMTGSTPQCTITECRLPDSTPRTSFYILNEDNGTMVRYRTVIRWKCLGEEYVLHSGSAYQVCTENGTWSGNPPVCAVTVSKDQGSLIGSIIVNVILFLVVLLLLLGLFVLKRKYDVLITKSDMYSDLTTKPSTTNQDATYTDISSQQLQGQAEGTEQVYDNPLSTGV